MVAWHEVPGKSKAVNPSRRVRYERVAAHRHPSDKARVSSRFTGENLRPYPNGTDPWVRLFQALRARLPSLHPSGIERQSRDQFFNNALGFI
jgi:hypothetical protein